MNRARTFLFTTAPPPPVAAAAAAALELAAGVEGEARRRGLHQHMAAFAAALGRSSPAGSPLTPIFPIILGPDAAALAAARTLREHGFFTQAIRPPTVPEGTARLRITMSAQHQPADLARLAQALRALPPAP